MASPSRDSGCNLRIVGSPHSRHVHHSPQFPALLVHVSDLEPTALAVDALSQRWQGRSMYMLLLFPLLNKVCQKLWATQSGEFILIARWWKSNPWFPTSNPACGSNSVPSIPSRTAVLAKSHLRWEVVHVGNICAHRRSSCIEMNKGYWSCLAFGATP